MARWQGGKVARWQGGKVGRWQGGQAGKPRRLLGYPRICLRCAHKRDDGDAKYQPANSIFWWYTQNCRTLFRDQRRYRIGSQGVRPTDNGKMERSSEYCRCVHRRPLLDSSCGSDDRLNISSIL
ncbi:hypothetical protein C1J03_06930 [Sulfitobacter sp. SK012]|nr:hypothetical protein C1J03_06930 [Sulfitobacter sp. SK012]